MVFNSLLRQEILNIPHFYFTSIVHSERLYRVRLDKKWEKEKNRQRKNQWKQKREKEICILQGFHNT